ncbi:MAG: hypothetical protein LBM08_11125 [Dysgonamonadaceae bacterium]|jgi:hypothetical protein|nr:hypothetical protein [Dysgonamonadaceae bacterium]
MKRTLLIIGMVALMFHACDQEDCGCSLGPEDFFKSYISYYVDCKGENSMRVQMFIKKINPSTNIIGGSRDYTWRVGETNPNIFSVADGIAMHIHGHEWSVEERPERDTCIFYDTKYDADRKKGFEKYRDLTGDTCFNQVLREPPTTVYAIITPLQHITITADKDFSEEYEAGSDLSGLFTVYFEDPYSVIKNGYRDIENTYKYTEGLPYAQSVVKARLSEANFPERPFIGDEWELFLDVAPEETGTYTFHIKATFVDGTVLEAVAPPVNIQGQMKESR